MFCNLLVLNQLPALSNSDICEGTGIECFRLCLDKKIGGAKGDLRGSNGSGQLDPLTFPLPFPFPSPNP